MELHMSILKSVGHIALKVQDLDKSVDFYNRIGFPEMLRLINDKGKPWIVYHRITDELYLELFPDGEGGKVPDEGRNGLFHLCLTVENADEAERNLKEAGVSLSQPRKLGRSLDGNYGMGIADPNGNRIEIMEMNKDCIQYKALSNIGAGYKPHVLNLSP